MEIRGQSRTNSAQSTKESPDLKIGIKSLGSLFTGMRRTS